MKWAAWRDEMRKISSPKLELKSDPWDLGIHSKRYGDTSYRGPAYLSGTGGALAHGAVLGTAGGLVAGGPLLSRVLTRKGRKAALADWAKDTVDLRAGGKGLRGPATAAWRSVRQGRYDEAMKAARRAATKRRAGILSGVLQRRMKGALKGAAGAGAAYAALRGLYNVGQYEVARASTRKR